MRRLKLRLPSLFSVAVPRFFSVARPAVRVASLLVLLSLVGGTLRGEISNRIVARVNDRILTLYDYDSALQVALARVGQIPSEPSEREEFLRNMAQQVMRSLWDEMLILSRADQKGWSVSDEDVQSTVQGMMDQNGIATEAELSEALAAEGLDIEQWKAELKDQLLYRQVMGREVYAALDIGEEDLRRYYRSHQEEFEEPAQIQVLEIVVLDRDDGEAQRAQAAEVLDRLRSGVSPAELAEEYGSLNLTKPIDLGWVAIGDLDATISEALESLEIEEWSEPIAGRGGLHVAKVLGRKEAFVKPFVEIEPDLRRQQEELRLGEKFTEYLIDLEKKAFLTLDVPTAARGFRTATGETPLNVDFPLLEPVEIPDSGDSADEESAQ